MNGWKENNNKTYSDFANRKKYELFTQYITCSGQFMKMNVSTAEWELLTQPVTAYQTVYTQMQTDELELFYSKNTEQWTCQTLI